MFSQINQLCVPTNLEPESPRQSRERLISPSDLFSVLYGKTQPQQVNMKTPAIQGTSKFMATEGTQTGLPYNTFILMKKPYNHACARTREARSLARGVIHQSYVTLGNFRWHRLLSTRIINAVYVDVFAVLYLLIN